MGRIVSYILFLLWLCYLVISSIILFTRGFLLTRTVLNINSTCLSHKELPCSFYNGLISNNAETFEEQCSRNDKLTSILGDFNSGFNVCLPPRARVILLIVDALRYDFTLYDEKIEHPLPFQNKIPVISKLLNETPKKTRLFKFIADPPTTTMQRLKALTTGSLPTFIDAGSNFATSEINEDNIIDQLIKNNHNVVFMGDDTWNGLYPNRFIRNYPYPSFNVWDLDTVDKGVNDHLYTELNTTDWSLLIGHFLGVDHCGHRYGPNHPEMERKLTEINVVIEKMTKQMDDNMMLFVIGDHGMTVTGDHGGESTDEVTAGMFVYSSKELLGIGDDVDLVKQVDLVPTLSTILGVPIPFQNLGILILNCLPDKYYNVENFQVSLYTFWSNVQQMTEYVKEYSEDGGVFSEESINNFMQKYSLLKGKLISVVNDITFSEFSKDVTKFLIDMREMCEEVWIQFEPFSMARGMIFLFLSMFFIYLITDGIPVDRLPEIFLSSFLSCSYIVLFVAAAFAGGLYYFHLTDNLLSSVFFATGIVSQLMLVMLIIQNWEIISLNWYSKSKRERIPNLICRVVLVFNLCGLFSNSYIIEEAFVLLFLLVTVILVGTIGISSPMVNFEPKKKNIMSRVFKWSKLKFLLFAIIIATLVRLSMYFWRCREEQQWCFASPHVLTNMPKKETTKLQWVITIICMAVFVFATKEWLRNCGNLNGYSMTVTFFKFVPTAIVVCIAGYWALKRMPLNKKQLNPLKSVNILAWAVYGLTSFGLLFTVFKPLCTYIIPARNSVQNGEDVIPKLFNKIKGSLSTKEKSDDDIPVVCGLATVYSSTFVMIGVYSTLLFSLLLGDAIAPTAIIMFLTASFLLLLTSVIRIGKITNIEQLFEIPNVSILIWIILAQYFFYGTGHQPAFPNISWESAFIGTSGIFQNNFIPGTLIILNTFCSYILMGLMLPLVLITPFTVFVMIPSVVGKNAELKGAAARGEVFLFERDNLMMTSMFTLACKYIMGHGIRVFASMLAATIHCRHLMVWKIFAPKLIFESIGMLVTIGTVMISFFILIRINRKVEGLIVTLKMS